MNLIEALAIQNIREQEPNALRRGFGNELRKALKVTKTEFNDDEEDIDVLKPRFVPDLYSIELEQRTSHAMGD